MNTSTRIQLNPYDIDSIHAECVPCDHNGYQAFIDIDTESIHLRPTQFVYYPYMPDEHELPQFMYPGIKHYLDTAMKLLDHAIVVPDDILEMMTKMSVEHAKDLHISDETITIPLIAYAHIMMCRNDLIVTAKKRSDGSYGIVDIKSDKSNCNIPIGIEFTLPGHNLPVSTDSIKSIIDSAKASITELDDDICRSMRNR